MSNIYQYVNETYLNGMSNIYQYVNETYLNGTLNMIDQLAKWNERSKAPQNLKLKYLEYLKDVRNKINSIARMAPKDAPLWCTAIATMAVELIKQQRCVEDEDLRLE